MVNGSTVSVTNKIASISVPTKTSDITNDSGFITTADIPEGAAASTTEPKMDGTANAGTELAFARGDHVHPTDTSRASASTVQAISSKLDSLATTVNNLSSTVSNLSSTVSSIASTVVSLDSRVDDLETAVGSGGSVDSKIETAINALDSSVSSSSNQAIASVTITDGKISTYTKITIPTNNNQLTNGAGYQTASDVSSAISSAITTVMDYKGTKATTAALPSSGNKQGDVWHVTADNAEYAWNGSAWEELGTPIDLSGYVEDADLIPISSTTINTICV